MIFKCTYSQLNDFEITTRHPPHLDTFRDVGRRGVDHLGSQSVSQSVSLLTSSGLRGTRNCLLVGEWDSFVVDVCCTDLAKVVGGAGGRGFPVRGVFFFGSMRAEQWDLGAEL